LNIKIEERPDWGKLATFVPNKQEPVYNWFYYKEGFARDLVFNLINKFGLNQDNWVLDPFCGSGTTLLACKQRGINSIGLDVLPISVFAADVKTQDYDTAELKKQAKILLKTKFQRLEFNTPPIVKRAFNKYSLEDVMFFKKEIQKIESEHTRNFLLLSLLNAAMRVSYAWKDGAVIKIRKKNTPPLRKFFNRTLFRMIKELEQFETKPCEIAVRQEDARITNIDDESIDAVITSPPYLNQIDYMKVYAIENFILGGFPDPPLRSYIGLGKDEKIPYFDDMNMVLKAMHRVCKPDANIAIVVGNGYLEGKIIESDVLITELAENIGFNIEKILVLNKRFALEKRTQKKGILRESLLLFRK